MKTQLHSLPLYVIMSLVVTLAGSTFAQESSPVLDIKNWSINLGHWVNEEQRRDGPDEPWQTVKSEWKNTMMEGGFFVETPGKVTLEDGSVVSWVQVWGHDPVRNANYHYWFGSDGNQGKGTFRWEGRKLITDNVVTLVNGEEFIVRCTQTIARNGKSMEMVCERLSGGTWWVTRKVKGKKVD